MNTLPSKNPRITVYLSEALKAQVEELATTLGMSTSELTIEALESFVQRVDNPEMVTIRLPLDQQATLKQIARDDFRSMEDKASMMVIEAIHALDQE